MFQRHNCPVCESVKASVYDAKDRYQCNRCLECGTIYVAKREDAPVMGQIYEEAYYRSRSHKFGYEDYPALRQAIHESAGLRFNRIQNLTGLNTERSVLDVGCALGYYLEKAQEMGWKVSGMDISEWAVQNANEGIRPFLTQGNILTTDKLKQGSYDCATLWDIIEQTPEPFQIVSKTASALKKGGWLVLMFRDIESPMAKMLGKSWIHYRPEEKYIYLNKKAAKKMLERAGLTVRSMEFRNTGKHTTFENLTQKMNEYSVPLAKAISAGAKALGLTQKIVYINFFDTRIAYAQKL